MSWTEERLRQLRELHALNLSFREIGLQLGVTRNAAIGKSRRLGLVSQKKEPRPRPHAKTTPYPRIRSTRRIAYIHGLFGKKPPLATVQPPDEISRNPVRLLELKPMHCRWPVSGAGINTLFCGDNIHGRSYCLHHYCLGHVPARHLSPTRQEKAVRHFLWPTDPANGPAPPIAPGETVA